VGIGNHFPFSGLTGPPGALGSLGVARPAVISIGGQSLGVVAS
jgi:hypothetical protein